MIERAEAGIWPPAPALTTSTNLGDWHVMATHQDITSRRCSKCGETKDVSSFYRSGAPESRLFSACKPCSKARSVANARRKRDREFPPNVADALAIGLRPPVPEIVDDAGRDWSWAFILFREVPGHPKYAADTDGNVWRYRRYSKTPWLKLKPSEWGGHLQVGLWSSNSSKNMYLHRLILMTFRGAPFPGAEGCHFPDPAVANNRLRNIRWGTRSENLMDRIAHGSGNRGERHNCAKLTEADIREIRRLRRGGMRVREIAPRFGISSDYIYDIARGKAWPHVAD